jgi:hypothetical protein
VSLPVLASSQSLPLTVHAYTPPISQTNYVVGIVDHGGGTFTLQFVGTVGVPYYVETTTNLIPPITWEAVSGSTNVVTSTNGLWDHAVTNVGRQQFFRSAVATP